MVETWKGWSKELGEWIHLTGGNIIRPLWLLFPASNIHQQKMQFSIRAFIG